VPKLKIVEKRIWDIEGFDVQFRQNGRDVRDDRNGVPQYGYERMAKNDMTVSDWKATRFNGSYAGFDVVVFDGDGNDVHGATKLGTVRDTYAEE
jgi:hypothetical protein